MIDAMLRRFTARQPHSEESTQDMMVAEAPVEATVEVTADAASKPLDAVPMVGRGPDPDHDNYRYRVPIDLTVTPTQLQRVLVIGSCLAEGIPDYIHRSMPGCTADFVLFNNLSELPESPPQDASLYDFQFVQLALRSVLPDHLYFRAPYHDPAVWSAVFEQARDRLVMLLEAALRWNTAHGLLTIVSNFLVPQQNAHGRLLPRYDFRNPVYLVERLNQALHEEVQRHRNVHVLEIDSIAATFGRKYVQDDGVWQTNHGAALSDADFELDQARIAPVPAMTAHYTLRTYEFIQAIWAEATAIFRVVRQSDAVKLVIVDLDDTLWRGVAAEVDDYPIDSIEGWPLGFVEALGFLKRRGIVLGIVSKNEESFILSIWDKIFQGRLMLEDFAVRRINWRPKTENVQAIIEEVNVLPRSVLFIDDNPVERAGVQAGLPDIRVLGADQYYLRRILLWSSETQVPILTDESARRTEMIQANSSRQMARKRLSRPEFLASLALKMKIFAINDSAHPSFARAFELINKTNQFNTTGKRWTLEECMSDLAQGLVFHCFEVEDRFSKYGLVGVLLTSQNHIKQMVMSCRVVGLDVEIAAVTEVVRRLRVAGAGNVSAQLTETGANLLCQTLFERCGFVPSGPNSWLSVSESAMPAHIEVE